MKKNCASSWLFTKRRYNIHAIFHGLFHWSFVIRKENRDLTLSRVVPPFGCVVLYYMLDVQLFLQPQTIPYKEHTLH
jgi:hypothetical protein